MDDMKNIQPQTHSQPIPSVQLPPAQTNAYYSYNHAVQRPNYFPNYGKYYPAEPVYYAADDPNIQQQPNPPDYPSHYGPKVEPNCLGNSSVKTANHDNNNSSGDHNNNASNIANGNNNSPNKTTNNNNMTIGGNHSNINDSNIGDIKNISSNNNTSNPQDDSNNNLANAIDNGAKVQTNIGYQTSPPSYVAATTQNYNSATGLMNESQLAYQHQLHMISQPRSQSESQPHAQSHPQSQSQLQPESQPDPQLHQQNYRYYSNIDRHSVENHAMKMPYVLANPNDHYRPVINYPSSTYVTNSTNDSKFLPFTYDNVNASNNGAHNGSTNIPSQNNNGLAGTSNEHFAQNPNYSTPGNALGVYSNNIRNVSNPSAFPASVPLGHGVSSNSIISNNSDSNQDGKTSNMSDDEGTGGRDGNYARTEIPVKGGTLRSITSSTKVIKKNRICPICNKVFNRPSGLKTHMHIHTGEKPYQCNWPGCGKYFSVRSNMIRHSKIHKRNGQYVHLPNSIDN